MNKLQVVVRRLVPDHETNSESGVTAVFIGLMLTVILGFAAFAVDVGQIYMVRAELQTAADAASTAAARGLPNEVIADAIGVSYTDSNSFGNGTIATASDVVVGQWDNSTRSFVPGGTPTNAVQVTTQRSEAYGNPVENLFAQLIGNPTTDVSATSISLKQSALLNFEGLGSGFVPDQVSHGTGIQGDPVPGYVEITSNTGGGPMIFDATCGGGPASNCTGGDSDLFIPGQGDVLIISEDGDSSDPDDYGCCPSCPTGAAANDAPSYVADASDVTTLCTLVLDFRNFGEGTVTITDVTLVDVEEDAYVWIYRDGNLVAEIRLEEAGDGMVAQRLLPTPVDGDIMVVKLNGSGAIDDIGYSETVTLVG